MKITQFEVQGYEKVLCFEKEPLRAIISIHNTNLGPACGGIRLFPYENLEAALSDVLRLSKGMSYKSALSGLNFGGGKSVIIESVEKKSPKHFQIFGECVESLKGKYIAAKDVNVTGKDLLEVKKTTSHVLGIEGEGPWGDPSPVTAHGVFEALHATVFYKHGKKDLKGFKIAIQGLGYVGLSIAIKCLEAGMQVWATDIRKPFLEQKAKELGFFPVSPEDILDIPCDIFCPCALGAILNSKNIERLKCEMVVGAANNQLESVKEGYHLFEKNILYVPDYLVNAGGIINVYQEYEGYDRQKALNKASHIYDIVLDLLEKSHRKKIPPFVMADEIAEKRIYGS